MHSLKTMIAILSLTLSACSANVGSQGSGLSGHTAIVDSDDVSVSLSVEPALADTLESQTDLRSHTSLLRLEIIRPEGCVVHEATTDSLRFGESALREAFLELDPSTRETLLRELGDHGEDLVLLEADAP